MKADFQEQIRIPIDCCPARLCNNQPSDVEVETSDTTGAALLKAHTTALDGVGRSTEVFQSRWASRAILPQFELPQGKKRSSIKQIWLLPWWGVPTAEWNSNAVYWLVMPPIATSFGAFCSCLSSKVRVGTFRLNTKKVFFFVLFPLFAMQKAREFSTPPWHFHSGWVFVQKLFEKCLTRQVKAIRISS